MKRLSEDTIEMFGFLAFLLLLALIIGLTGCASAPLGQGPSQPFPPTESRPTWPGDDGR